MADAGLSGQGPIHSACLVSAIPILSTVLDYI
jgi:hypothetical protein